MITDSTSKNERPNLSFLQSAWSNSDYYQSDKLVQDDNLFHVELPQLQQLGSEEDTAIVEEIEQMIFVAKTLCLIGSICGTFFSEPLIYPLTLLWSVIWFCKPFLNWMQPLSIFTAFLLYSTLPSSIFTFPLIAFALFCFAERFYRANDQLKLKIESDYSQVQSLVDDATSQFRNNQHTFLTTVSQEIQDVALMVITTLEQFSPASILSNTHELLSACSLAVPISSIFAIHTTIRQICHISSHLQLLSKLTVQAWPQKENDLPAPVYAEFDIGELLQNVGDALAGVAAKLDVNLVIYHCDSSLHHSVVIGDEGAIRHTLFNHLRNILECCTPGASIEVGLDVTPIVDSRKASITFYITHTCSPAIRNVSSAIPNANLTAQLLAYINATSTVKTNKDQTCFKFTFELEYGSERQRLFIQDNLLSNYYANIKFSNEPSLEELDQFISKLKGIKMVLHAPEMSIFAKHLTSCLTSWNTDISHVPVLSSQMYELETESRPNSTPTNPKIPTSIPTPPPSGTTTTTTTTTTTAAVAAAAAPIPSPAIEEEHIHSIPPAFILIDNDIQTLQQKLSEFRSQPPASANVLQAHYGGRRKQPKPLGGGIYQNFFHQGTTAIIHFTSLANYKAVRESIQAFASSPDRDPFSMPRVVVVPKPAGPRRFLTALHTALNNSVVEPHFLAIATAPASPISPMVSMLIQRELAIQTTSPNDISPGRRRPLSGVFSPPSEGSTHYFSTHTSPIQSSPRRRSNTEVNDYLTAKPTEVTEPDVKAETVEEKPEEKPETMTRSMSNVKMRKKKKGKNAFANSVSPPINVLIVEDNIINQAILSTWMKKHKIKFSVASDGLEAVRKWENGGFHLVLMDIQLPGMNGIEATRKIRAIEREQKIGVLPLQGEPIQKDASSAFQSPVIIVALTASSLESDRHAALAAGCNDFLTKPVSLEWLEKKIIEWGCMQALIDFEGWRRWKQTSEYQQPKKEEKTMAVTKIEQSGSKKERPKDMKGILLHGVGNLTKTKKNEKVKKVKSDKMEEL